MLAANSINYSDKTNFFNLLDILYPIGSIYITVSETSPASNLGGTWTEILDGTILAKSSGLTIGDRGGAQKIAVNMLPSHAHNLAGKGASAVSNGAHTHYSVNSSSQRYVCTFSADTQNADAYNGNLSGSGYKVPRVPESTSIGSWQMYTSSNGAHTHNLTGSSTYTGGGQILFLMELFATFTKEQHNPFFGGEQLC